MRTTQLHVQASNQNKGTHLLYMHKRKRERESRKREGKCSSVCIWLKYYKLKSLYFAPLCTQNFFTQRENFSKNPITVDDVLCRLVMIRRAENKREHGFTSCQRMPMVKVTIICVEHGFTSTLQIFCFFFS